MSGPSKLASHCLQPVRGQDAEDLAAECPHLFQVKGAGNTRELLALDPLHPDRGDPVVCARMSGEGEAAVCGASDGSDVA